MQFRFLFKDKSTKFNINCEILREKSNLQTFDWKNGVSEKSCQFQKIGGKKKLSVFKFILTVKSENSLGKFLLWF